MGIRTPELCRVRDRLATSSSPEVSAPMKPGRSARDYVELFRSGTWFRGLATEFQERLLQAGVLKEFKEGQRLFARGDPPSGLIGLVDGAVRLSTYGASGREALLMLVEPPAWVGEISLFDGLPRTHDAIADVPSVVVQVPQSAIDLLLAEQPLYWRDLGRLMAQQLRLALLAMEETALLPAAVRLPRRLVMIAHHYGNWDGQSRRVIGVRQEQLAQMLSISRQTTNQILKGLEAQGAIQVRYGEIEVLDLEKLRQLGEVKE